VQRYERTDLGRGRKKGTLALRVASSVKGRRFKQELSLAGEERGKEASAACSQKVSALLEVTSSASVYSSRFRGKGGEEESKGKKNPDVRRVRKKGKASPLRYKYVPLPSFA